MAMYQIDKTRCTMRIEAKPEDTDVLQAMEELASAESRLAYTYGEMQLIALEQVELARSKLNVAVKRVKLLVGEQL